MPTYEYRCKACGAEYTTLTASDRLDSCANDGCDGTPRRLWSTGLLRSNIRAVPESTPRKKHK